MPIRDDAPSLPVRDVRLHGEIPRTRFEDMELAKRVTVLSRPEDSPLESYMTFARTCHNPEPVRSVGGDDWELVSRTAGSGRLLGQDSELYYWTLRLEGLTRTLSHQLVRARVGWTFSETCTGDQDWRHGTFLIPRSWQKNPQLLEATIQHALRSKLLYASLVDGESQFWLHDMPGAGGDALGTGELRDQTSGAVLARPETWWREDPVPRVPGATAGISRCEPDSTQNARYILHPNLKVYVHAKVNLAALRAWYAARSCTMTQAWEMVVLAERVKAAVIEASPWAAPSFQRPCDSGQCWWHKNCRLGVMMTNYYEPDAAHDTFDRGPRSSMYGVTPFQVNSGHREFEPRLYVGLDRANAALTPQELESLSPDRGS